MLDILKKNNVLILLLFLSVSVATTSCQKDSESENGSELAEGKGGEGNESGGEGNEGGNEGGNESGVMWNRTDQANEIVNGIRLILSYDQTTQSFVGTLENLNTTIAPLVRVEVHVFDSAGNSIEYGPTTPGNMNPGEIRNVILPVPGAGNFVTFNMHPEVG